MGVIVDFTKITFENPINVSLQIGDSIYVSNILNGGILSTPVFVANVINVGEKFIVIDKDNTSHIFTDSIFKSKSTFIFPRFIN